MGRGVVVSVVEREIIAGELDSRVLFSQFVIWPEVFHTVSARQRLPGCGRCILFPAWKYRYPCPICVVGLSRSKKSPCSWFETAHGSQNTGHVLAPILAFFHS